MHARNLLNLFLLLAAVTLAAAIFLRPGLDDGNVAGTVTDIDPQQVRHIRLARPGAATLEFTRQDDKWHLDGQPALPADDFQVHTILALLDTLSVRSYPADALDDLAALGLQPPQASASFDGTDIDVGGTDAIENLRYLRIGDTVHLVGDRFQHLANAGFSNFVNRSLLPDGAAISGLELPGLSLSLADGVNWEVNPPLDNVSADDIDTLVGAWHRAGALYVRRYEAPPAAAPPPATIRITRNGAPPVEFLLIARTPDLVLARPDWGIQYHLPANLADGLLSLPGPAEAIPEPAALDDMPLPDSIMPEADALPTDGPDAELPEPVTSLPEPAAPDDMRLPDPAMPAAGALPPGTRESAPPEPLDTRSEAGPL